MDRLILILTVTLSSSCFGQNSSKFVIKEVIDNHSIRQPDPTKFRAGNNEIFEDRFFVVSRTCNGEFGGTINFRDKRTNIEYSATSTCPIVVNKLNGKYYVTNTLAHLSGFSEILEISDPRALTIAKLSKPEKKAGKTIKGYLDDEESKSNKGTKQLVDSIGVLTMATFPFQGQLYHIVTNFKNTYITKITQGKFETIEIITNQRFWTYQPEVFRTTDNHYIVFFDNGNAKGYYDIFENNITIVRQK